MYICIYMYIYNHYSVHYIQYDYSHARLSKIDLYVQTI